MTCTPGGGGGAPTTPGGGGGGGGIAIPGGGGGTITTWGSGMTICFLLLPLEIFFPDLGRIPGGGCIAMKCWWSRGGGGGGAGSSFGGGSGMGHMCMVMAQSGWIMVSQTWGKMISPSGPTRS